MKRILFILIAVTITMSVNAQKKLLVSPFHRLPKPGAKAIFGATSATTATAWRFTAAAASYDIVNNKILTGIGFGWNKMHVKTDSSGNSTWYTDLTINGNVYAAGNAVPTYSYGNTNIIGLGVSVGILNKLINIGYVYYPPMNGGTSKSGVIAGISIPLN